MPPPTTDDRQRARERGAGARVERWWAKRGSRSVKNTTQTPPRRRWCGAGDEGTRGTAAERRTRRPPSTQGWCGGAAVVFVWRIVGGARVRGAAHARPGGWVSLATSVATQWRQARTSKQPNANDQTDGSHSDNAHAHKSTEGARAREGREAHTAAAEEGTQRREAEAGRRENGDKAAVSVARAVMSSCGTLQKLRIFRLSCSGISGDTKKRRTLRIDRSQRTIEALVGSLAIASVRECACVRHGAVVGGGCCGNGRAHSLGRVDTNTETEGREHQQHTHTQRRLSFLSSCPPSVPPSASLPRALAVAAADPRASQALGVHRVLHLVR